MCNTRRGDILIVSHACSVVENDIGSARSIMLGHHLGDDIMLLERGDAVLVLNHVLGTLVGTAYLGPFGEIIERDIVMPLARDDEGAVHCYRVLVHGQIVYVREHYIENDRFGMPEMTCLTPLTLISIR